MGSQIQLTSDKSYGQELVRGTERGRVLHHNKEGGFRILKGKNKL